MGSSHLLFDQRYRSRINYHHYMNYDDILIIMDSNRLILIILYSLISQGNTIMSHNIIKLKL